MMWPLKNDDLANQLWEYLPTGQLFSAQGNVVLAVENPFSPIGSHVQAVTPSNPPGPEQVWRLQATPQNPQYFWLFTMVDRHRADLVLTLGPTDPVGLLVQIAPLNQADP